MRDSVIHPSSVRQLQNCTLSDSGCMNDSVSIEDDESNTTSVVLLVLFVIMMIFQGLKLFCIDIPRDRNNARTKASHRQDLIENLIKKRVKRVPAATGNHQDLENGLDRVVASPRNCRLQKIDLVLPISNAVGDVDEEEQKELICPICWEDYKENDEICFSQNPRCAHSFHFDCIKPWLEKHDQCPICRSNYLLLPIEGDGIKRQALDTSNHRAERAPNFPSSLASALQQIRRELIESSAAIREVQSEMVELASELGDTNGATNREAGKKSRTMRPCNRTSFNTDMSEAAEEPSLDLEMEEYSLDDVDLSFEVPTVDRIITV